jgi:RNA polymerase sigma-70 factor (ECF subfamily)
MHAPLDSLAVLCGQPWIKIRPAAPAVGALNFPLVYDLGDCYGFVRLDLRTMANTTTSSGPDDAALLAAVAGRDASALEQLYQRHSALLFSLALKILMDRAEAEEVLQDAFVQVWKNAQTYDSRRGKPLGWLITLTRSRAIDRLRARQTRARITEAAGQEAGADPLAPPDTVGAAEAAGLVRRAVQALPAEQRTPIELAYFGGLTQSEIAEQLGQPLGTVKTRMRTGLLRLRDELGAVATEDALR